MAFSHIRDDLAARAGLTFYLAGDHVLQGGASGAMTGAELIGWVQGGNVGDVGTSYWDDGSREALRAADLAAPLDGCCDALADWFPQHSATYAAYASHVRGDDLPGIAAMAAKNVQPITKPALSLAGQELDAAELLAALEIVRARKPQAVSTPAGLLVQAGFDHRLGRWNGEV